MPKIFLEVSPELLKKIHVKKMIENKKSLAGLIVPMLEKLTEKVELGK